MEVGTALGVKKGTLLFARRYAILISVSITNISSDVASTAAVGIRFVAVGSIVAEARRALLPAHRADTAVAFSA